MPVDMTQEVLIVFVLTFGSFCSGDKGMCSPFEMKSGDLNKQLVGHSIAEISVRELHDCVRDCMSLSVCKSTDYYVPKKTCKLNDVDSSSVDKSEIKPLSGAVFSDISEWPSVMVGSCSSRPCAAHQRCVDDTKKCYCLNITCKKMAAIDNGKSVLSIPGRKRFLDTATVECNTGYVPSQSSVKCLASGTWEHATCVKVLAKDCKEILQNNPDSVSGQYDIMLWKSREELTVYCDMNTNGGGWTIFQKRFDGSTDFNRSLNEYVNGFGSVYGEFWLGLKYIQEMAEQGATELRIDMSEANGRAGYETFQDFSLTGPEFKLMIGTRTGYSEIDSKSLALYTGFSFSTYDHDVDTSSANCAAIRHGGWWYQTCSLVGLNNKYCTPGTNDCGYKGLIHFGFALSRSLKTSSMMIRRVNS